MQSGIPVDKGLGVCSAVSDDPAVGANGIGRQLAGSQTRQAVSSAAHRTLPGAPSWGRVLATTVSLWVGRRVARLRHPRLALILTICVVVAAAAVVSVVQVSGTSSRTASAPRPHAVPPAWARGAAGAVRTQAATWAASQLSSAETVGCDPLMCAALRAHGVAASRAGAGDRAGCRGRRCGGRSAFGRRAAERAGAAGQLRVRGQPGRGPHRSPGRVRRLPAGRGGRPGRAPVRGRAVAAQPAHRGRGPGRRTAPGGPGGQPAADHARDAGLAASLAGGRVRRRLARGAAGQAPFRQVTITGPDAGDLAASLALVRAQRAPYQPAQAAIVRLPGGQGVPAASWPCASTSPRRARWGC